MLAIRYCIAFPDHAIHVGAVPIFVIHIPSSATDRHMAVCLFNIIAAPQDGKVMNI